MCCDLFQAESASSVMASDSELLYECDGSDDDGEKCTNSWYLKPRDKLCPVCGKRVRRRPTSITVVGATQNITQPSATRAADAATDVIITASTSSDDCQASVPNADSAAGVKSASLNIGKTDLGSELPSGEHQSTGDLNSWVKVEADGSDKCKEVKDCVDELCEHTIDDAELNESLGESSASITHSHTKEHDNDPGVGVGLEFKAEVDRSLAESGDIGLGTIPSVTFKSDEIINLQQTYPSERGVRGDIQAEKLERVELRIDLQVDVQGGSNLRNDKHLSNTISAVIMQREAIHSPDTSQVKAVSASQESIEQCAVVGTECDGNQLSTDEARPRHSIQQHSELQAESEESNSCSAEHLSVNDSKRASNENRLPDDTNSVTHTSCDVGSSAESNLKHHLINEREAGFLSSDKMASGDFESEESHSCSAEHLSGNHSKRASNESRLPDDTNSVTHTSCDVGSSAESNLKHHLINEREFGFLSSDKMASGDSETLDLTKCNDAADQISHSGGT